VVSFLHIFVAFDRIVGKIVVGGIMDKNVNREDVNREWKDLSPNPLPKGKGGNKENESPSPLGEGFRERSFYSSRFTLHASLILITFLIYLNSLPNDFIFDDIPLVKNSLNVMNMGFWDLVSSYRPLRYLTYAFDYHVFGMNPWGFRLMNIFYHALTVLSLFWMLKVFGLSKKAAFIASLIFAIHPVNTDAVAYISGRRDVLMGLFYVLSLGWFMKFYNGFNNSLGPSFKKRDVDGSLSLSKRGLGRVLELMLSFLFLFLSISSKEMGATIPLIFILYIFYKDGAKLLKKRWFYIAMMSLLLLFSFFVFFAISSGGSSLISLHGIRFHGNSPEVHYLTASTIWLHYLKLTVFPLKLILDNANYPLVLDWNFKVFFSVLSMFIYGWVVWKLLTHPNNSLNPSFKKRETKATLALLKRGAGGEFSIHATAFWLIFFVISLGPVLQIIPLHEIVAVHYLYVPVIGFCVIVGILFDNSSPRPPSLVPKEGGETVPLSSSKRGARGELRLTTHHSLFTIFPLLLLLSFFSIRTITRNFELKDIWTAIHADEKWGPLSFRGYFTLGAEYVNMKFPDKAWEYYQKSINTGAWDPNLLGNIIGLHIVKGNHDAAINYYEEMTKKGEYITSPGTLNMAVIYMINGKCDKAEKLATSFVPFANQTKRIETVKKCREYNFAQFDMDNIQDVFHKQELMKELGLEVERKPFLMQLIANSPPTPLFAEKRGEDEKENESNDLTPGPSPKGKGSVESPSPLGEGFRERSVSPFTTHELLNLINELAIVNLQSDVPEAIKYYKMERDLYKKINEPIPEIVTKSISVLEDYQHKVLVEGKYYKLEW